MGLMHAQGRSYGPAGAQLGAGLRRNHRLWILWHRLYADLAQLVVGRWVNGNFNQARALPVERPFERRQQIVRLRHAKPRESKGLRILDKIRVGERRAKRAAKAPLLIEPNHPVAIIRPHHRDKGRPQALGSLQLLRRCRSMTYGSVFSSTSQSTVSVMCVPSLRSSETEKAWLPTPKKAPVCPGQRQV